MTRGFLASSISFTPALNPSGFLAIHWHVSIHTETKAIHGFELHGLTNSWLPNWQQQPWRFLDSNPRSFWVFPARIAGSAGEPPAVPAQQATPVAKVTFAELHLHPADVDSCCQMAKDKAQLLNSTCDLLTLPTICCLILGKCMETLIKILILFHSWPTCGMYILHPKYICSSRAVMWCLRLPSERGLVNVWVSLPYFLKALSKVITSYWFAYGQLMKSQALSRWHHIQK